MSTFQDVLSAARALSATERILLAETIWEDIPPADWPLPDAQWIAEAQRRSAELDADPSIALSREELWRRVDAKNG